LENVTLNPATREVNYFDTSITENTRACYPLEFIDNAQIPAVTGHPKNIVFLTCDAFSVLPPVSKLTPEQAIYHFYSGYTSKIAGTEQGVKEPTPTFSACFGEAFMPMSPQVYADLLYEKINKHNVKVWLVNTGWTGGRYGIGKVFIDLISEN
jgi:phosphoenolpyruvate carboxykinase (ATP)